MTTLLVQGCSKSKRDSESPLPAIDIYTGYYFKILKKADREGETRAGLDVRILSAEHGLLQPDDRIEPYDRRMRPSRADELRESVLETVSRLVAEREYDRIVVNLGEAYREATRGLESRVSARVVRLCGGLGERGSQLKRIVRGADAVEVTA